MQAQSGDRQRSGKRRLREGKRGRQRTGIAREGFLDRRSKRCFWLLLSPQTKVARAGARNYPRRRQILRLRRCAATPHPPPSGAPSPQGEGLRVRHSHRGPLKGKANGGASFNTADPSRGRLGLVRPGHPSPCDLIRGKAWRRRQERKTSTVAGASGRASLRADERTRSPFG